MDEKLIGEASPNTPNKLIEFPILHDSLLELRDEGHNSVIKFTKFELVSCSNDHVNNLLHSSTKIAEGWNINVDTGKWGNNQGVDSRCGPQWYGWTGGAGVGTISTKLYPSSMKKCGRLYFGNCWNAGVVKAYMDGKLIGEASPNVHNKIIEFPILHDSLLELRDEGANSVIKFTKFDMVSCSNDHVNNLLHSSTKFAEGWNINVEAGKWTNSQGSMCDLN